MSAPCPTLGFFVAMDVAPSVDTDAWNSAWDDWIDVLERRGLHCGGGGSERLEYAVASDASQATEEDRIALDAWLAQNPHITAWHVGPLKDLTEAV